MRPFLPNALLLVGLGAVAWRIFDRIRSIRLSQTNVDGSYTDTYYVVAHVHLIVGLLLAIGLPGLLHLLLLRRASRAWVRRASYACLFGSLSGLLVWVFSDLLLGSGTHRRYVDYSEIQARMQVIGVVSMGLVLTACSASVILSIGEWVHRRRRN